MKDILEIAPHRKKSQTSDTSQSKAKSKHKHEYAKCLISEVDSHLHVNSYCVHCGKIKHEWSFEDICDSNGRFRIMSNKEILEKYKDLPVFKLESEWQKFVDLEAVNETY